MPNIVIFRIITVNHAWWIAVRMVCATMMAKQCVACVRLEKVAINVRMVRACIHIF